MDKHSKLDIAAFPELFDGMEQFIAEQAAGIKRASALLAIATPIGSLSVYYLLQKIF